MTTSIQSSSLLEKYDSLALTQRLFRGEEPGQATPAPATVLGNLEREGASPSTPFQNLFTDLNTARAQRFGPTYGPDGATRSTTNTILVGYG